jgi:2-polyprenyl-3-methyl-5-hydroxy-6-metoxy-1,4-benzoquinol methylase
MNLLAAKGIHYLVTRFGPLKLRGLAFDEKYRQGHWSFHSNGDELSAVINRYLRGGDLLIMGCGGASVLEGMDLHGVKSVLGIDLSQEAIRLANRFASDKVSFQLADMVTFECPNHYDLILFSESLNYVPVAGQESLLRRLAESLKPGGVFVVTFSQAKRYKNMIDGIRRDFVVLEDRTFTGSNRHLIVFNSH